MAANIETARPAAALGGGAFWGRLGAGWRRLLGLPHAQPQARDPARAPDDAAAGGRRSGQDVAAPSPSLHRDVAPPPSTDEFPVLEFPARQTPDGEKAPDIGVETVKACRRRSGMIWSLGMALRDVGGDPMCWGQDEYGKDHPHFAPNLAHDFDGVDRHAHRRIEALQAQARRMMGWGHLPAEQRLVIPDHLYAEDPYAPCMKIPPVKYDPTQPYRDVPDPRLARQNRGSAGLGH